MILLPRKRKYNVCCHVLQTWIISRDASLCDQTMKDQRPALEQTNDNPKPRTCLLLIRLRSMGHLINLGGFRTRKIEPWSVCVRDDGSMGWIEWAIVGAVARPGFSRVASAGFRFCPIKSAASPVPFLSRQDHSAQIFNRDGWVGQWSLKSASRVHCIFLVQSPSAFVRREMWKRRRKL